MLVIKFSLLVMIILSSSIINANAYLDPGTFSIIINFFIALAAGIAAYISLFWSKIKNIFKKKKDVNKNGKKENKFTF